MARIVYLFPGQGSQYVGMAKELFDAYQSVRNLFGLASELLGIDFGRLCFQGPESELILTDNVQPAITLVNVACHMALKEEGIYPAAAAGHSLGEYAALYVADALDFEDLMQLVKLRGAYMRQAADQDAGGMIAVMHLGLETVQKICRETSETGKLEIANINSPNQIILSGELPAIEKGGELAKQYGAKMVVPLKVSGAWHSQFMRRAREQMENILATTVFKRPAIPVVSNVSAAYELEPDIIRNNLGRQITRPVLWMESMQRLVADGYEFFVEVGPKRILRGLMREIDREVKFFNAGDLKSLHELLQALKSA